MPTNDKQVKKLSEEIKGALKALFEANVPDPMAAPGANPLEPTSTDPLADPMAEPGQDPLADPMADPMAAPGMDPMADPGMGMDDLNGGDAGPEDPNAEMGADVPVSDVDQSNLNAIPTAPQGETEPEKVAPEPNIDILGNEEEGNANNPLPNFVLEVFGNKENAEKVIGYLVEQVVMKYDAKKGANTTHGEQELHDTIIEKLADFLNKKTEDSEEKEEEFKKELSGLDKDVKEIQKENLKISEKYLSLLKDFDGALNEAYSYLQRNELFWQVYGLAIPAERKAHAIREMASLSLEASERYVKQLRKLEESTTPAARPKLSTTAGRAELLEHVKRQATMQDVEQRKKNTGAQLFDRVLRNAGIVDDDE